ncbi:nucleotidyltransferase domain-containing protein [Candidatus Woesearchaeota archaeon]|nr:nucleotidyltransferase domain-containing protein [Candidatus Woesearchaeota archaeon]
MNLEKIKKTLKPGPMPADVKKQIQIINNLLNAQNIQSECVLGGSTAKNTNLKGDFDIDLFVKFDRKYKDQDISKILENAIQKLKPELVHGSRNYFQLRNTYTYEIVPVLDVKDEKQALNVTDMSPLHVQWVKEQTRRNNRLPDDIRLAKMFCKSAKVYGAESYLQGFSGHVLDILLAHYGNFENFIANVSKWPLNGQVVIDIEKHHKSPLKVLNRSKKTGPLIVVDPLQKERNAAAALSKQKYNVLIKRAKEYMQNPSERFFKAENISLVKVRKENIGAQVFSIQVKPLNEKKDVAGAKVKKIFDYIIASLKKNEFTVLSADWEFRPDNALLVFVVKDEILPLNKERRGPPLNAKYDVEKFKNKHLRTYTKNNRIFSEVKRDFRKPSKLFDDVITQKYVTEKCKSAKLKKQQ